MKLEREHGLTIVEVIVASALFMVASTTIVGVMLSAQNSEAYVNRQANLVEDVRVAIDRFARDARQGHTVTVASCDSFEFRSHFRTSAERTVEYRFHPPSPLPSPLDGTLTRSIDGGSPEILVHGLTSATFSSPGGTDCFASTDVTLVELEVTAHPRDSDEPVVRRASVKLRNA
jgi:type II secretory pathway pseudopilin PulG